MKRFLILLAAVIFILPMSCELENGEETGIGPELESEDFELEPDDMATKAVGKRTIYGYIRTYDNIPCRNCGVEAYDSDTGRDDHMKSGYTDDNGYYELHYENKRWDLCSGNCRRPDIYVKWYFQGHYQDQSHPKNNHPMKKPLKISFSF